MTSPSARRVQQHEGDSRPAWLWAQDGQALIWQNDAAHLFLAKLKKHGLKLAPPAVPIKGQVARTIRLGSAGRSSLARIQFLAGDKPASSTCAVTPLPWQDGQPALLIVGVDPIEPEILLAAEKARKGGEPEALAEAQVIETVPAQDLVPEEPNAPGAAIETDDHAYERELESWRGLDQDQAYATVAHADEANDGAVKATEDIVTPQASATPAPVLSRLSSLVDRLAADNLLYTPLDERREIAATEPAGEPAPEDPLPDEAPRRLFRVTGRGLTRAGEARISDAEADLGDLERLDEAFKPEDEVPEELDDVRPSQAEMDAVAAALKALGPSGGVPDSDTVERVSRYNFDELSRILNDRVGETAPQPSLPKPVEPPATMGALVNLGGETLVLNRLPLGILVFRDQQILFANRAITGMVGYDSVENLRAGGLSSVFPAAGPDTQQAGPVNHLVQRDGTLVPVTARLQSISWQGRPALMLSASATEVRTGHEGAVRAFAESFAETRGDGFLETNRGGVISAINGKAVALLGQNEAALTGVALSQVVAQQDLTALQEFLERPARFAETARPCVSLRSAQGAAEVLLFAQGQAGTVTGYFGFVHRPERHAPIQLSGPVEADPALLARISRGVRRPLNTIIGFSDLIRSEAFGALDNARYESYANDIAAAGHEIAALVDELDDFTRLRDGRYLPQRASIELTGLLESCVVRIRHQASNARVIVRNAIAENLPRVTADRASLAQAVLNLLASAIDQTPSGGAVVISAQLEESGGISVHVRDSSTNAVDLAERFVVFRDGTGRDGRMLAPVRSSVGLALTRSLLAVNAFSLSVDPAGAQGLLFSLLIPADLVE
ncbi:histidine kinase dimerization/phospho-acceptor domain-containing protein [uncultured Devosia sp.]|uniref:histidine kinase dimerization/phospho-acceptor domain-containing protein n=1 Tax=uncultured Devosia sp. TaxID=211434 RepID=UPI0035C9E545